MSRRKKDELIDEMDLISIDWEDEVPQHLLVDDSDIEKPSGIEDGKDVVPEEDDIELLEDNSDDKHSKNQDKSKSKKTSTEEDEDDEDDEDIEDLDNTPPSKDIKKSSPALVFAKFLKEKGVLNLNDEETSKIESIIEEGGDEEALEYLFNAEVENRLNEIKSSYDDDIKEYLELRDYGVSSENAAKLVRDKNLIEQIEDGDIEGDDKLPLRKQLIGQYLVNTTKMSKEEIDDYIETLVDTGKDITWAKKALNGIKKQNAELIEQEKERVRKEREDQAKKIEETRETIKKAVMDTNEILGNKVTTKTKQKIIKMLLEPAGKTPDGQPVDGVIAWLLQDPLKNKINLAYAISTGLLDGKLTSIKKKVKSDIISELEETVVNKSNLVGGNNNIPGAKNDTMEALKEMFG